MTDDEPYTNLDLDTAKAMMIAAGQPDIARALQYQADGVRNLVQGEWGQSFVRSFEDVLARHIGPLAEEVKGLRGDVQNSAMEVAARLGKNEADIAGIDQRVIGVEERVSALEANNTRLDVLEATIKARPALREAEYRAIAERAAEEAIRRLEARGDGNG
jgi:hypothetical protein